MIQLIKDREELQRDQDFIASSLANCDTNYPLYFLIGTIELYLKTLDVKSKQHPDTVNALLQHRYDNGLTFHQILETYCGPFAYSIKQCQDIITTIKNRTPEVGNTESSQTMNP